MTSMIYIINRTNFENDDITFIETLRTVVIWGSGGHTTEMIQLLTNLNSKKYTPMHFITCHSGVYCFIQSIVRLLYICQYYNCCLFSVLRRFGWSGLVCIICLENSFLYPMCCDSNQVNIIIITQTSPVRIRSYLRIYQLRRMLFGVRFTEVEKSSNPGIYIHI
jgi:hypothetical protein